MDRGRARGSGAMGDRRRGQRPAGGGHHLHADPGRDGHALRSRARLRLAEPLLFGAEPGQHPREDRARGGGGGGAGQAEPPGQRGAGERRMEQRLSLITLGVADVPRSRRFYEALGWRASGASQEDVTFFQAGGMALALWGRDELAQDAQVLDGSGFGGVALAYNTRSREEVNDVLDEARAAGAQILRPARET